MISKPTNNPDYKEISKIIYAYEEFLHLKNVYFSSHENKNDDKSIQEKNIEFIQTWPEKKAKIKARMKKNNYFSKGGRIGDEKTLRKGDAKYYELLSYFSLEKDFTEIAKSLTSNPEEYEVALEEYIKQLKTPKHDKEQKLDDNQSQPQ